MSDTFWDTNIEVGRKALRTFTLRHDLDKSVKQLGSIYQSTLWKGGVCIGTCNKSIKPCSECPGANCVCGVYGHLTLDDLHRAYRFQVEKCVAVIAPEGIAYVGSRGLRAQAARIVAYWTSCDDDYREVFARECDLATEFIDINEMLAVHGFSQGNYGYFKKNRNSFISPASSKYPPISYPASSTPSQAWEDFAPLMKAATPGGIAAVKSILGISGIT